VGLTLPEETPMKTPFAALALALSILTGSLLAAAAEESARAGNFHSQLTERYCAKLREGAVPYVLFVRRLAPIHAYTYADFAPAYPGAPVKADCHVSQQRIAEVYRQLRIASADTAR
jgi:hypothetical protein